MFIFSLSSIFIFAFLFLKQNNKNGKIYFILLSSMVLCLYAGLRGHNLQPDIPTYVKSYEKYAEYSFNEIIALYSMETRDPSYYFTAWLFSRFFTDVQWWLAAVGAFFVLAMLFVIYKESENPLLSILMFLSLGSFEFALSGLRQSIALSIIVLSYLFIKNRKPVKFIISVLIASLFHFSAILFLIAYPLARVKLGLWHVIVAIVLLVLFIGFQSSVRTFLENFLVDSQYQDYVSRDVTLNFSGFIIQICIFIFNLVYYKKTVAKNKDALILYNLVFIGLLLQLYSSMIAEFFRLSYYFSFANFLLVPLAISSESDDKIKDVLKLVIGLLFVVYIFWSGIPKYEFFWM